MRRAVRARTILRAQRVDGLDRGRSSSSLDVIKHSLLYPATDCFHFD